MTNANLAALPGTVHLAPDRDRLFEDLASILVGCAFDAIHERGVFHIALSGGSTPEPFYMQLVTDPRYRMLPWDKAHIWIVDERRVPEDHELSNIRMIRESLSDHVVIRQRQVHPMPVMADDPAAAYETALAEIFGETPAPGSTPPRMDFMLLGMGSDGHTASLFPHTPAVRESERWVAVNEGDAVTPPPRVTMTFPLINASRQIAVLISGEGKAEAVQRVTAQHATGQADAVRLPITGVNPLSYRIDSGRLGWFLDDAAAGRDSEAVA